MFEWYIYCQKIGYFLLLQINYGANGLLFLIACYFDNKFPDDGNDRCKPFERISPSLHFLSESYRLKFTHNSDYQRPDFEAIEGSLQRRSLIARNTPVWAMIVNLLLILTISDFVRCLEPGFTPYPDEAFLSKNNISVLHFIIDDLTA